MPVADESYVDNAAAQVKRLYGVRSNVDINAKIREFLNYYPLYALAMIVQKIIQSNSLPARIHMMLHAELVIE